MEILPLFVALFVCGHVFASLFPGISPGYYGFFGIMAFAASWFVTFRGMVGWLPLIIVGISVGGFVYSSRQEVQIPWETLKKIDRLEGNLHGNFVGEFQYFPKKTGLSFHVESAEFTVERLVYKLPGKVKIEVKKTEFVPEPGQRYCATGTLRVIRGRACPMLQTEMITQVSGIRLLNPLIGTLQRWVRDGTTGLLSHRHQTIVNGLLLGDTSGLSLQDRKLFRESGLSHILAVSGQHILILAFVLVSILTWLGIPPLSRGFLVVLGLLLYGAITSGQPSVWRALIMYMAAVFVTLWEANPGPVRPVALAALLLLLYTPAWIHHLGFQLSFMAVLGIILGRPALEKILLRLRLPLIPARYLAISLAANLAVTPLAFASFGFISLVSFVLNPLLVWSFSLILPMSLGLAICGNLWFAGGVALAAALSFLLDIFFKVVQVFCALPFAVIEPGPLPGVLVVCVYGGMLYLLQELNTLPETVLPSQIVVRSGTSVPPPPVAVPDRRPVAPVVATSPRNYYLEPHVIEILDHHLQNFVKRSLKGSGNLEVVTFPVNKLSVEGQTLYYRLDDLSREVLRREPERILQAQIYGLALLAAEIMFRIFPHLEPPPTPSDLFVKTKVRQRYLALVLILETFFASALPARTSSVGLTERIGKAQVLLVEGKALLLALLRSRDVGKIPQHLAFRQSVLEWCREISVWSDLSKGL
jgi:ComEC/Rec2-related protein